MASCEKCKKKCNVNMKMEKYWKGILPLVEECFDFEPIETNANRIRAMSDEELAEFLNTLFIEGQIEALHEQYPDSVFNQKESSLKWLQAEAEE